MTNLSPAAQAVLTALTQQEYGLNPADIPNEAGRMACIASAALRAAACLEVSSNFDGTLYETGEDEFRAFLHVIAAELKGVTSR